MGLFTKAWLDQVFQADALRNGKPVRRAISSVQYHASEAELKNECRQRNLILMKTATQYIIFPTDTFKILVGPR